MRSIRTVGGITSGGNNAGQSRNEAVLEEFPRSLPLGRRNRLLRRRWRRLFGNERLGCDDRLLVRVSWRIGAQKSPTMPGQQRAEARSSDHRWHFPGENVSVSHLRTSDRWVEVGFCREEEKTEGGRESSGVWELGLARPPSSINLSGPESGSQFGSCLGLSVNCANRKGLVRFQRSTSWLEIYWHISW